MDPSLHCPLNDDNDLVFVDESILKEFQFDSIDPNSRKRKLSQSSLSYLLGCFSQNYEKARSLNSDNCYQNNDAAGLCNQIFVNTVDSTLPPYGLDSHCMSLNLACSNPEPQIHQDQQHQSNLDFYFQNRISSNSNENFTNNLISNGNMIFKNLMDTNNSKDKYSSDFGFQYILAAATSGATKVNEDTITYLNQGQNYEITLKPLGDTSMLRGRILKSVIRLCFYERRLQQFEKLKLQCWQQSRRNERILEVNWILSYGLKEIKQPTDQINIVECYWEPIKEVGAYIRVNCISTEFTARKSGGEKGVPFRIQIDTYLENDYFELKRIHSAACQIKVFKMKGADRKNKQDLEKRLRRPLDDRNKFQDSIDCTIFNEMYDCNDSDIENRNENEVQQITNSRKLSPISVISSNQNDFEVKDEYLDKDATIESTQNWLEANRFTRFLHLFTNYSAIDMLKLSRDDLIDLCDKSEGIRLFNAIHPRPTSVALTLYIEKADSCHQPIYLKSFDLVDFKMKLFDAIGDSHQFDNNSQIYLVGPKNIKIELSSDVICHLVNESIFGIEVVNDSIFLREK